MHPQYASNDPTHDAPAQDIPTETPDLVTAMLVYLIEIGDDGEEAD